MARIPMVTRTLISTRCTVLCMDLTEGTPFEQEVVIPRTYKVFIENSGAACVEVPVSMEDFQIDFAAFEAALNENTKAVHIKSFEEQETLYGMTEQKFMEYADVLPPRGTKEE